MNTTPLISVIVPSYNQAQYLDECLQSVLDQTVENWECIIINDGSPDHTEEVAERWTKKDSRFKYFFKENGGVSSARNYGIKRAIGEWILPLDGDDFINTGYILEASKYFSENVKIIYGNATKFGIVNENWILPQYTAQKMAVFNIIHNCAFFKKENFDKLGGYDENMLHGLEDWEFWINLLKNGGKVKQLPTIHLNYRVQKKSRTTDLDKEKFEEMSRYIEAKHIDFFHKNLGTFHELAVENLDLKSMANSRIFKFYTQISKFFLKK